MSWYILEQVTGPTLWDDMSELFFGVRTQTARLIAHVAEFDARKLYLPKGHPSMFSLCVHHFGLSKDEAYKRIHAARTARLHPPIFEALNDGRLNLTAINLLAPHLTSENCAELMAAAAHKDEICDLLAARTAPSLQLAPERVETDAPQTTQLAPERVGNDSPTTQLAPERVDVRQSVAVNPAVRAVLKVRLDRDKLRYAQELYSHQIVPGDVDSVLDRALDLLIRAGEKRKFAATDRPRPTSRPTKHGGRYIPAAVRNAVWKRDQGQCTLVGENGHRCPSRTSIEFDHVLEVARGGEASVDGVRLQMPGAQPVHRRAHVRGEVHGAQA